jgi:hypothetical protein
MSPVVWDDFIPRVQAVATQLGITFEMPNEPAGARPEPSQTWLDIEVASQSSVQLELGDNAWIEYGQGYLHIMVPIGTGWRDALVKAKAFQEAFRGINTTTPKGLVYRNDQSADPMANKDDGMYRRLTVIVNYQYQDRLIAPP